jgi:methyl-accepting chemotaxis protein WspA
MKMSIGTKIAAGYVLAIMALGIIGLAAYLSVNRFLQTTEQVNHSHEMIEDIRDIVIDLGNVEAGQRGYTVTDNISFLEPYTMGLGKINTDLQDLRKLSQDSTSRQMMDALEPVVIAKIAFARKVVDLQKSAGREAAVKLTMTNQGKRLMDQIDELITKLEKTERDRLQQRTQESHVNARTTILIVSIGVPLTAILLTLLGFFIVRDISKPLRQITGVADMIAAGDLDVTVTGTQRRDEIGVLAQAFTRMVHSLQSMAEAASHVAQGNLAVEIKPQSDKDIVGNSLTRMVGNLSELIGQVQKSGIQVNTSATEIAATARQQQATAGEISATTTEIGATSKEIAATSRELVASMTEVAQVAEDTAQLAGSGQTALTRMETTMRQIMDAASAINARLTILNEKAGNINTVVTTITKVADQTNLLSLNAAIEAEKAGEAGRGFAVVATEIRRLADQTALATYDIEQIVKEMQSAVSAGVMGMDKFSEEVRRGVGEVQQVSAQLVQIIQQVQALTPNFEAVNEGMQSQSQGAQQISEALAQLAEAAQQTVESLRQSNLAIDQLNEATRGLQDGVSLFKLQA